MSLRPLTNLQSLTIASLPVDIAYLTNLTHLHVLANTSFVNHALYDDDDPVWFHPLSSDLETVKNVSKLTKLESLMYHFCLMQTTDWGFLSSLSRLARLELPNQDATFPNRSTFSLDVFSSLRLREVSLENNRECIYNLEFLQPSRHSLTALNVRNCVNLTMDVLHPFHQLRKLTWVNSTDSSCFDLGDKEFSSGAVRLLDRLDGIDCLNLQGILLSDTVIRELASSANLQTSLTRLTIHGGAGAGVSNWGIENIRTLTRLEDVQLTSYEVTAAAFGTWAASLTSLRRLQMYCPKLRRAEVQALLPNVEVLH